MLIIITLLNVKVKATLS